MAFTMCSSSAIVAKAGAGANPDASTSTTLLTEWSDFAEGQIIARTKINWLSNFSGLPTSIQNALGDAASDIAGTKLINWDMSLYPSREIVQTQLDILRDNQSTLITELKLFKSTDLTEY